MSSTVHKFLIHGLEFIEHAFLPIGQLLEVAHDSRNKDFKKYRRHFTRKISGISTTIFNMLLVRSDPVISIKQKLHERKFKVY